jgi:hypothetical protein
MGKQFQLSLHMIISNQKHVLKRFSFSFLKQTGRELKLEIEPGTYLLANSGCLVTTIQDMVSTEALFSLFLLSIYLPLWFIYKLICICITYFRPALERMDTPS